MSGESQSESIWQYAMRPAPASTDARSAPLSVVNDQSGIGGGNGSAAETTDFSDGLGSLPTNFNFHGLAQTQTQSQGAWLSSELPAEGTESQKENMHLPIPSGSQSPLLSAAVSPSIPRSVDVKKTIAAGINSTPAQLSHVTQHVTGASPRAPAPTSETINASAPAPFDSVPFIREEEPVVRATPLKHKSKSVSFLSPTAPPPPPTIPRIKTMPSRINRYAPRDISPSSQDSFAGPLPPQDLNTFVRNSSILNNTFIRGSKDGEPGDVFQRHTHISSASASDLPPADDMVSISQSLQQDGDEETTPSQVVRAAFDPRLSPPRDVEPVPEPVVLVKDTQSDQHSQASEGGGGLIVRSHSRSSSSTSFQFPPSDEVMVPTQPNTQSTQPNTQPTQTDPLPGTVIPPSTGGMTPMGPSPLPVPPHRKRAMAALQAARLRATDEVIPETPPSVSGPSVQASTVPRMSAPQPVETPYVETQYDKNPRNPPPRLTGVRRKEKGKEAQAIPVVEEVRATRPLSKGKAKQHEVQPVAEAEAPSPSRVPRSAVGKSKPEVAPELPKVKPPSTRRGPGRPRESEIIPDSQEEEQQLLLLQQLSPAPAPKPPSPRRSRPRESEVVPDSQEEEQLVSSPAVPLREVFSRQDPPTPTPAAVKSSLRKGKLPEGVTHTRGGGRASSAKGKGKAKEVQPDSEEESAEDDHVATPMQDDAHDMEVDEEQPETEEQPATTTKRMRVTPHPLKKGKKTPAPKKQKKYGRQMRSKAAATEPPAAGPSTRSRKRKSEDSADSTKAGDVPRTTSVPAKKRQRKNKTPTPAPPPPIVSGPTSTRVFARRTDKSNYYHPGTVTVMASPTDPAPTPTSTVFRVDFDDGHEKDVDVEFMRQFELEPEDVVHVTWRAKGKNCAVHVLSIEQWELSEIAEVQDLGRGPDGDDYLVEGRFMSISEARVHEQWNERRVSTRTLLRDQDFDQPERNKRLVGIGFVITLPDLPRSKRSLVDLIEASGGVVFKEWTAFISLSGTVETAGKRMSGKAKGVRILRKDALDQLFCLADEPRTTPKYLIALALGVPCLSIEWVLERVFQEDGMTHVDWPAYILPAGYNPATRMPASQGFDRVWWRESGKLSQLISHPPTFKPFAGKTFLCIGTQEFLFSKSHLGTFPMALLAMGASYVEAVTDPERVKKRPSGFDYIVVDDDEPPAKYRDAICVDTSWIKKCLVTGIVGPVPWPDREGSA